MNTDPNAFGRRYNRFLSILLLLKRVTPHAIFPWFRIPARWFNPYNQHRSLLTTGANSVVPTLTAGRFWNAWLDNHFRFILSFLNYRHFDEPWLSKTVTVENPSELELLKASGGLLLTFHNHHQNTLCCALGIAGCTVSAVAADPADSPLFPFIGKWANLVNRESSIHFRSGEYIFTGKKRKLLKGIHEAFRLKHTLICLIDFNDTTSSVATHHFMGKLIRPPTGIVEQAIRNKIPIFTGSLSPSDNKFTLKLKNLNRENGVEAVVEEYLNFVAEEVQRAPHTWQGWDWFSDLPPTPRS